MKSVKNKRGYALDVVRRQLEMLRVIPRLPQKYTARELTARIAEKGFDVSKRTIERNLLALQDAGFDVVNDGGNPQRWSWGHRASAQMLNLDLNTALTLKLAYAYVKQLVPASLVRELKALVDAADKSLEGIPNNVLARWPDKIRVLSTGPVRKPPDVVPEAHQAVSEALLKNLQVRVHYRSLARGKAAEYVVSPLGMVLKGGVIYVVVSRDDKPVPFTLSLHRILKAEVEHLAAIAPVGWNGLDEHIDAGHFLFPPGTVVKDCPVTLRFNSVYAQNLQERPLSTGQTVKQERRLAPDGKPYFLVRARVTVSEELVRWLLQYGDHVEVVKPASLRKRMRSIVASLHSRYKANYIV